MYIRWYRRPNYINLEQHTIAEPMYPYQPFYITRARSRTHLTPYLPNVYNPHKSSIAAY